MVDLNTIDLQGFVSTAVKEVFDTMLSMEAADFVTDAEAVVSGNRIVGSVGFAGRATGCINLHFTDPFATEITAAMLGSEPDEIDGEEVHDVIGEVSNMVGGDLKSRLCDAGFPCELSIPSTTRGSDFRIESKGWMRCERFSFKSQKHTAIVEVFLKSGNNEQ